MSGGRDLSPVIYQFYSLARVCAGFLGLTALLGIAWFATSLGTTEFAAGLMLGLTSLAAAFVPQRKLSIKKVRRTIVLLCLVGIGSGLVLIAGNLAAPLKIEWDVVVINLLNLAALIVMVANARNRR